jgi:hypothetical protein
MGREPRESHDRKAFMFIREIRGLIFFSFRCREIYFDDVTSE